MTNGPVTLSTKQAASRLGLNQLTVQRWIREGKIKAGRLPGRRGIYRIPVSEIERLERGE